MKKRYAEIITNAEEVAKGRQSIIIKLNKIQDIDNSDNTVPNLSHEEIGDLIFDTLKIKPDDILGIDLYTGRYDTRELIVKANADVSSLVNKKIEFKRHLVEVLGTNKRKTTVYFKYVPLNIPDIELLNICMAYGEPVDGQVKREKVTFS